MRFTIKKATSVVILFSLVLTLFVSGKVSVNAGSEPTTVDIMFTSDVHSHLNSFTTIIENEQKNVGGIARINNLLKQQLKKNPQTLIVDGGDFSMGTLIQTIFASDAPEVNMQCYMGYDVGVLGNHEFDYGSVALSDMFKKAMDDNPSHPELVLCNADWSGNLSANQRLLKDTFEEYGMKDYVMFNKNGVNIAVIGVFGKDSLASAPTCELKFSDPVESVKKTVKAIKANEQADMIVLVSHSGLNGKNGKSEDEIMAKSVPELDFIVSGHSHTTVKDVIKVGDTYIGACGEYGEWLGSCSMQQRPDGRWDMVNYELLAIDESVEPDAATAEKVEKYNKIVEEKYLNKFGYNLEEVIAKNDVTFSTVNDLYKVHTDQNLGNFIADAYAYAARSSGLDVEGTVSPSGTIRETIPTGDLTMEEVFNIYPLGIGADGVVGFPLIKVYLYGSEIKTLGEVDATVSDLMDNARLFCSGVEMSYNPHRMILDKEVEIVQVKDGVKKEFEDSKLYLTVTDLYSAQMIGAVNSKSYGILSIVPKKENGDPITDFHEMIVYDQDGNEIKAWQALAMYMMSFDKDSDGIPQIPTSYTQGQNIRKNVIDDSSISAVLGHPGKFTVIIISIILVLAVIVISIVALIIRKIKKKKAVKIAANIDK